MNGNLIGMRKSIAYWYQSFKYKAEMIVANREAEFKWGFEVFSVNILLAYNRG